jgi:hypothetical protein
MKTIRNFKMRSILGLLIALGLMFGITVPAFAATTQDVAVDALPTFVCIANSPALFHFGAVAGGGTADTTQAYFTVVNTSSIPTNVSLGAVTANWTGGTQWLHDDTGAGNAPDTAGLMSSNNTGAYNIAVHNVTPQNIYAGLPASTNFTWELKLFAPSTFADGTLKSMTVRLTAVVVP